MLAFESMHLSVKLCQCTSERPIGDSQRPWSLWATHGLTSGRRVSTSACWHSTNERSMQIDQLFAERHAFPTADFASVIVLELIAASVADHPTCAPTNLRRCCSMCPTTADSSVPLHATR